jgi:integrase
MNVAKVAEMPEFLDVSIHDLDHTFAFGLVCGGAYVGMNDSRLGHPSRKKPARRHPDRRTLERDVDVVSEMLKQRLRAVGE